MSSLFELRGPLPRRASRTLIFLGVLLLIGTWEAICLTNLVSIGILPTPWSVMISIGPLVTEGHLFDNLLYSLKLNFLGYLIAIGVSLPLGFLLGLIPLFRELFEKQFDATRFIPLTAITGIFVVWFGIGDVMKIAFLAVSIILYLVPIIIQRIREVDQIFIDTAVTLNATRWQQVKRIFLPRALSSVFIDVKNIVAISWTYIIVAELLNRTGGIGSVIYLAIRQSHMDQAFMGLIVIVFIGFLQDRLFVLFDKLFFRFKYEAEKK
mgnify:CR=1 FL=1